MVERMRLLMVLPLVLIPVTTIAAALRSVGARHCDRGRADAARRGTCCRRMLVLGLRLRLGLGW